MIRLQAGVLPHFYFKELTLKLSRLGTVELENLTFSPNVTGASYTSSKGEGLVNLCFSDFGLKRAEKYTTLLEEKRTTSALREARFFADRLLPELKVPFQSRIAKVVITDGDPNGMEVAENESPATPLLYTEKGELIVTGTLREPLAVYSVMGRCVHRIIPSEVSEYRVSLAPGLYVVNKQLVSVK